MQFEFTLDEAEFARVGAGKAIENSVTTMGECLREKAHELVAKYPTGKRFIFTVTVAIDPPNEG